VRHMHTIPISPNATVRVQLVTRTHAYIVIDDPAENTETTLRFEGPDVADRMLEAVAAADAALRRTALRGGGAPSFPVPDHVGQPVTQLWRRA
jgi:fructose-1-phosphate kinase PfkB-like protein